MGGWVGGREGGREGGRVWVGAFFHITPAAVAGLSAEDIRSFFGQTRAFHRVLAVFHGVSPSHRYVVM